MSARFRGSLSALLLLASFVPAVLPASNGDVRLISAGEAAFLADGAGPVREFAALETVAVVPSTFDPFAHETISLSCIALVKSGDKGVRSAKGSYSSDLVVFDHRAGVSEAFPLASGRVKTDADGTSFFAVAIPTALFADGFASGDVSAWVATRADFSNRKKGDRVLMGCFFNSAIPNAAAPFAILGTDDIVLAKSIVEGFQCPAHVGYEIGHCLAPF